MRIGDAFPRVADPAQGARVGSCQSEDPPATNPSPRALLPTVILSALLPRVADLHPGCQGWEVIDFPRIASPAWRTRTRVPGVGAAGPEVSLRCAQAGTGRIENLYQNTQPPTSSSSREALWLLNVVTGAFRLPGEHCVPRKHQLAAIRASSSPRGALRNIDHSVKA